MTGNKDETNYSENGVTLWPKTYDCLAYIVILAPPEDMNPWWRGYEFYNVGGGLYCHHYHVFRVFFPRKWD